MERFLFKCEDDATLSEIVKLSINGMKATGQMMMIYISEKRISKFI